VGKLGIVDWKEDCSNCHNCVKRNCVYGLYTEEAGVLRNETGYLDYIYQCKGCLVCIQNCTKNILTRIVNPEFRRLGDTYYTPDIVLSTWYQAETGRIPVSGSGYGGKFSGPGFDSMWTDMSEIVRPTRDGIHGREYINTTVELGRKLPWLSFKDNSLTGAPPARLESPVPLLFDIIPETWHRGPVLKSMIHAANHMGIYTVVRSRNILNDTNVEEENIIPFFEDGGSVDTGRFKEAKLVMLADDKDALERMKLFKQANQQQLVAIRIDATPDVLTRTIELARGGVDVIHISFDLHGMEKETEHPRHVRYVMRDVHTALVKEGLRDQVTIIVSGGVALAEHMAKAIICGADLVGIDLPLLIALECRLCLECGRGEVCQIELDKIETEYASHRITNLICAWRNQLLELMGAMGLREVRRLRGETGRCMFFEDLEKETFGSLFGKRTGQDGGEQS
jgi:Pyruvate/2-oxoacid:ferredoxin oxidoreductase delta subunit